MRRAWLWVPFILGCGGLGPTSHSDDGGGLSDEMPPPSCTPWLVADRSTVNLGAQSSGVGTVTLTNPSGCPSGDVSITTSDGVIATGCAGPLAAHASCTITITAVPTVPGAFSGKVSISAIPGTGPTPFEVFVVTTDTGERFIVTPHAFELGPIPLGFPVPPFEIKVSSQSSLTDLTVTASGPDVSVDPAATTCGSVLPAGQRCSVVASFRAASVGNKSDAITIAGGGASGKVVTVPITANVVTGVFLVIDPSTAQALSAFAGQASAPVNFAVSNRGDGTSDPLSVTLTGPDAAEFVASSDCTALAPLTTCTVTVAFQPAPASVGTKTATLEVSHFGTSYSAVSVALTGIAVPPP